MSGFIHCSRSSSSWSTWSTPNHPVEEDCRLLQKFKLSYQTAAVATRSVTGPGSKATTNSNGWGSVPLLVKAAGWLAAIGHGRR